MRRFQEWHEVFIPNLCHAIGAESYLELGTYVNATIANVPCARRYGVDPKVIECKGVQTFRMTSSEFIDRHAAELGPFDVVFIDADHSKESAMADFHGIWTYVSPEGLVLLHDTNPETEKDTDPGFCGDSWKFAKYLSGVGFECVTLPYHPGITIVRKRMSWGPSA